jgi:hypothetical protein
MRKRSFLGDFDSEYFLSSESNDAKVAY